MLCTLILNLFWVANNNSDEYDQYMPDSLMFECMPASLLFECMPHISPIDKPHRILRSILDDHRPAHSPPIISASAGGKSSVRVEVAKRWESAQLFHLNYWSELIVGLIGSKVQ